MPLKCKDAKIYDYWFKCLLNSISYNCSENNSESVNTQNLFYSASLWFEFMSN